VRDVAHAHILALEKNDAEGRHILAEKTMSVMDLSSIIKKQFPGKYRLPLMTAPKPLLKVIGGLFGVTPRFVSRNVGYPLYLNTSRSRKKLGLNYRNMEESVKDMVEQMERVSITN
jgi:nucleoside-diphosphate-sugar epimerase